MVVLADLLKELYIIKAEAEIGGDVAAAFAQMSLPLADIAEAENSDIADVQAPVVTRNVFDTIVESMGRTILESGPQEVYPVDVAFFVKITDGSITRYDYSSGDGQYTSWQEMDTSGTAELEQPDHGRSGSEDNILVDINKRDSIPNDSKVLVTHFSESDGVIYYYFGWEGWGTKATPYEIHTDPTTDDNKTWDAESPPADKDGKKTKYSNIELDITTGTPGEVTMDVCTWEETVDSEGHVRIVGDETKQSVTWESDDVS